MAAAYIKGLKVTTPMKEYVSRQMVREWKSLGRILLDDNGTNDNLESTLENIAMSNPNNVKECCYQMLSEWQNRMASEATADQLIDALRQMGQKLLAENLEEAILNPCQTNSAPITPVPSKSNAAPVWPQTNQSNARCSDDIKNRPIELKHRKHVYLNIGESWDELGEELGFNTCRLQCFEKEAASLTLRCKIMLKEWERKERHTVGELEEALLRIYEGKLAKELVEL